MRWLGEVDQRFLYLLLAIFLLGPLVKPIGLPISIGKYTEQVYSEIEKLSPGDIVVLDISYGPGSKSELHPQAVSIAKHLESKDVRVIGISFKLWGPVIAEEVLDAYKETGKEYGKDFCNLGYLAGDETAMGAFIRDPIKACPADYHGNTTANLEIMQGITSGKDVQLLICYSDTVTSEWVRQAGPLGVPLISGTITVLGAGQEAFLQSGQLKGLLVGMRAGAEYELKIDNPGLAVAAMDAQSLGHLLFITFIILGNIAHFTEKRSREKVS